MYSVPIHRSWEMTVYFAKNVYTKNVITKSVYTENVNIKGADPKGQLLFFLRGGVGEKFRRVTTEN